MISTDLKELHHEVVLEEGAFASLQIFVCLFIFETKVSCSQAGSDLCIEVSLAFCIILFATSQVLGPQLCSTRSSWFYRYNCTT